MTLSHIDLPPLRGAAGSVRLPGSKSISNRVLLLAGLSAGTTVVRDLLDSDDTRVMLAALQALGCTLDRRAEMIARLAGPFGPFSDAMRLKADQILVVSRFKFTRDEMLEAKVSGK